MIRAAMSIPALFLTFGPALCQEPCFPREDLATVMRDEFGASLIGQFMLGPGPLMREVYGANMGPWLMVETRPDGLSCIVAGGQAWIMAGVPQGEEG